jgi:hypothetical protein
VKTVVVLQPQFFPWRGVFEQIRLADEFVHLDDAQFQKGGFTNRVQLKTANGSLWLTVPVLRHGKLPPIAEVEIDYKSDWREKHLRTFAMSYARAPFAAHAQNIMNDVYAERPRTIAELDIAALERCCAELGLHPAFTRASATPVDGPARRAARPARRDLLRHRPRRARLLERAAARRRRNRCARDGLHPPPVSAAPWRVRPTRLDPRRDRQPRLRCRSRVGVARNPMA